MSKFYAMAGCHVKSGAEVLNLPSIFKVAECLSSTSVSHYRSALKNIEALAKRWVSLKTDLYLAFGLLLLPRILRLDGDWGRFAPLSPLIAATDSLIQVRLIGAFSYLCIQTPGRG